MYREYDFVQFKIDVGGRHRIFRADIHKSRGDDRRKYHWGLDALSGVLDDREENGVGVAHRATRVNQCYRRKINVTAVKSNLPP